MTQNIKLDNAKKVRLNKFRIGYKKSIKRTNFSIML